MDAWIQSTWFEKYKFHKEWHCIQEVALFAEYAQYVRSTDNIQDSSLYWDQEEYLLAGDLCVRMDLDQARNLASFFLRPRKETIPDEWNDVFEMFLKCPLLQDSHWRCLLSMDYHKEGWKECIWQAYFKFPKVIVSDHYLKEFGEEMIRKEQENRQEGKRSCYNGIVEKKEQYDRLISGKTYEELEKEVSVYKDRWDAFIWTIPSALIALLQMYLLKSYSGIGIITAIIMTVLGIVFLGAVFIIRERNILSKHQIFCGFAGSILFSILGWIVLGLNSI